MMGMYSLATPYAVCLFYRHWLGPYEGWQESLGRTAATPPTPDAPGGGRPPVPDLDQLSCGLFSLISILLVKLSTRSRSRPGWTPHL